MKYDEMMEHVNGCIRMAKDIQDAYPENSKALYEMAVKFENDLRELPIGIME